MNKLGLLAVAMAWLGGVLLGGCVKYSMHNYTVLKNAHSACAQHSGVAFIYARPTDYPDPNVVCLDGYRFYVATGQEIYP